MLVPGGVYDVGRSAMPALNIAIATIKLPSLA